MKNPELFTVVPPIREVIKAEFETARELGLQMRQGQEAAIVETAVALKRLIELEHLYYNLPEPLSSSEIGDVTCELLSYVASDHPCLGVKRLRYSPLDTFGAEHIMDLMHSIDDESESIAHYDEPAA